jgi:penicillin V acylase-like amidase (Ntn superfamily)
MEITRNIILDLLPLYLANEVSADTRALIEKYLETDEELANVAKQLAGMEKPKDIPVPISQNDKMTAYRKARRRQIVYAIILAGVLSILAISILMFFLAPS